MRRFVALVLVGALGVAACGSSASSTASSIGTATAGDCNSRPAVAGKGQAHDTTFCGPATVTIKIGGTTFNLNGGRCVYDASVGFALNVGTMARDLSNVSADGSQFFGIVAPIGSRAVGMGLVGGRILVITDGTGGDNIRIADDHKSGSISGSDMTYAPLTASFTC